MVELPAPLPSAKTGDLERTLDITLRANIEVTSDSYGIHQHKSIEETAQPLR